MAKRIITISREFGSGGRFIGEEIAKKLGIAYYDKNIISKIAEKSGLSPEYIQEKAELSTRKGLFAYAFTGRDITGKSVVSSGIYERCFKQDGKLYHHILNPKTGYPYDNGLISVTIISDQSVDGDALSTTCFALGLDEGLKFAEKKGVQAVFITEDYELHYTNGFQDEIKVTDVES